MDSVSVAFELMQIEIDGAVENLNAKGASEFRASNYAEAKRLGDLGEELRDYRARIQELAEEWSSRFAEGGAEAGIGNDRVEPTRKILKHTKASRTNILVRFPDGSVVSKNRRGYTCRSFRTNWVRKGFVT